MILKSLVQTRYFFVVAIIHLCLVLVDMTIYDYKQGSDETRFIHVANEFLNFKIDGFDPGMNCNTAPGYPLFLALIKMLTQHNKYCIAIIQALLYSLSLYFLLSNLYKKNIIQSAFFHIGFAVVLFSPEIFQSNGVTLNESFCGSLLLILSGSLVGGLNTVKGKILFIVSLSLLILSRFEYILVLPVLFIPLLVKRQYHLFSLSLITFSTLLILNGLRNYKTFGQFNPFNYGSGSVIYAGNNMNGDGSWHIPEITPDYIPSQYKPYITTIQKKDSKCRCIEMNEFYKKMAANSWRDDWLFQLGVMPVKFMKLWIIPGNMDIYTLDTKLTKGLKLSAYFDDELWPWYGKYKHFFYISIHWIYIFLMVIGIYIKHKYIHLKKYDYFVFSLAVLISIIYSVAFYGLGRFHIPIWGILILYCTYPICRLQEIQQLKKNKMH